MAEASVLIVDDDRILCEELSEILIDEGWKVECVHTAQEGRTRLAQKRYAVLILDYKMPDYNGIEFLEQNASLLEGVSVFLISGSLKVEKMVRERVREGLVNAVIQKPFMAGNLLGLIKSAGPFVC